MVSKMLKEYRTLRNIYINRFLGIFGYEVRKKKSVLAKHDIKEMDFSDFLSVYFMNINLNRFFLIQIGANDGIMRDPIFKDVNKFKLKGLLVEPQKDIFLKLKKNYKNSKNLVFVNMAISHKNGMRKLYKIRKDIIDLYEDFSGMASFDYNHVKKCIIRHSKRLNLKEKPTKYIVSEEVETVTFQKLLDKNKITDFNFLQIDTEEFDFEIIKMIDFNKYRPNIINYEHGSLSDLEKKKSWQYLKNRGYNLFTHGRDTTAYKGHNL